ncbi:MAG: hypothetical protein HYT62_02125 [Candidatus Yanofskybacteria bacterium]|nr:hypothetical protein [Candidatus Yanofskybacteria bacterium]
MNEKLYRTLVTLFAFAFAFGIPIVAGIYGYNGLIYLQEKILSEPGERFYTRYEEIEVLFISLGLVLMLFLMYLLYKYEKKFFRREYDISVRNNKKTGMDYTQMSGRVSAIAKGFAIFFIVPILIMIGFLSQYIRVGDDYIIVSTWSLYPKAPKVYDFDDLSKIGREEREPKDSSSVRVFYTLYFKDGNSVRLEEQGGIWGTRLKGIVDLINEKRAEPAPLAKESTPEPSGWGGFIGNVVAWSIFLAIFRYLFKKGNKNEQ